MGGGEREREREKLYKHIHEIFINRINAHAIAYSNLAWYLLIYIMISLDLGYILQ